MASQNYWGVWEESPWEESERENREMFEADMPDWENRLAEYDDRESGRLVTESDLEIGESDWHQQIADWDAFFAIQSEIEGTCKR